MAFCNSCGATVDAGTKFCNKCGAAVPASAAPAAAPSPAGAGVPAKQGSSALKIILIIIAVIVGLGIVVAGTGAYLVHRAYVKVRDNSHIEEKNGNVKIETPLGNMESSTDTDAAARDIGIDLYPGARVQKNSSVTMTMAGMHTVTAVLETEDTPDQVADFYHAKMPNATSSGEKDHYTLYSGNRNDMTTVTIESGTGKTMIQLTRVSKAGGTN